MADIAERIDELYQLPPGEFTAARTALAKSLGGPDAARIKRLEKPAVVPWAVNQVYWRARPVYQRLLQRGQAVRTAQVAVLEGRPADVREATRVHRQAITEAVQRAIQLAADAGLKPNPDLLARMFEALSVATTPASPPGRFTAVLQPVAFEVFAGVTPAAPTPTRPVALREVEAPARPSRADRAAERKREEAARKERARLEAELKTATRAAEDARAAEARARQALDQAAADVRKAEEALVVARKRREDFAREP